jgi:hypothetical protein
VKEGALGIVITGLVATLPVSGIDFRLGTVVLGICLALLGWNRRDPAPTSGFHSGRGATDNRHAA